MPVSIQKQSSFFINVHLLDGSILNCEFLRGVESLEIFDYVCNHLSVSEKKYFGLRFKNEKGQRHWLALDKLFSKQLKRCTSPPYVMYFRVFLYPCTNIQALTETTLCLIISQIRRDFEHGRVLCTKESSLLFSAYIYNATKNEHNEQVGKIDLNNYPCVSNEDICQLQQEISRLSNLTPKMASIILIEKMHDLGVYGLDPHPLVDKQCQKLIGLYPRGICYMEDFTIKLSISWATFHKIVRRNSKIYITWKQGENKRSAKYQYKSKSAAKHLEECIMAHAKFYANYIAPQMIRGTFATLLGKSSQKSACDYSMGCNISQNSESNDSAKYSQHTVSPTIPRRSPRIVRSLTEDRSSYSIKPLNLNKSDDSLSDDSTNTSFESRTNEISNFSKETITNSMDMPHDMVFTPNEPLSTTSNRSNFILLITGFQMGIFVLFISLILFFILLAMK